MRAVVTGACGFIGARVAKALLEAGWDVTGIDMGTTPLHRSVRADIAEPGPWQSVVEAGDLVVHTAALVTNAASQASAWRVNVLGTRRVVEASAGAERFVHLSSVRAFSDRDFPAGVDEWWPVRPDGSAYVDTKIASEQVVLQAHAAGELRCTILRPGDVYGPGSRPWTVLPLEAIKAHRFVLPAYGRGVFSPVYVDDLVDAIQLVAGADAALGQVFTITDGTPVTCATFFDHYARMLGMRRPPRVPTRVAEALAVAVGGAERAFGRPSEVSVETVRYLARRGGYSSEKATRLLGYRPAVPLDDGMERIEAWLADERIA